MSQATELLNNMTTYSTNPESEPHIVVGADRYVIVPEELKRIAVQGDHAIETVTFDCPRYWDTHDMSKMKIYVNYLRMDEEKGSDLCTNITIDETDPRIMHFDWTVTGHLSAVPGPIAFLVCIQKMNNDGTSANHWNSELNTDMFVSEGLEVDSHITAVYPGIITQLLTRMDTVEAKTTDEALYGYMETYISNNPDDVDNVVKKHVDENAQKYVDTYMRTSEDVKNYIEDYADDVLEYNTNTIYADSNNIGRGLMTINKNIGDSMADEYYQEGGAFARVHVATISEVKKDDVIEFSRKVYIESSTAYTDRVLITNTSKIVTQVILLSELRVDTPYVVENDGYFYYCMSMSSHPIEIGTSLFDIKTPRKLLVNTDKTLTKSGEAADAKVVGDKFNNINDIVNDNQQYLFDLHNSLSMSLYDDVNEITPSDVMLGTIFSSNSCKIGDSISGLRPNASPGYFMYEGDIQAGDVLEIGDNFSIPEGLTPSDNNRKMLIVDNENIIVDMVDSAYLTTGYVYVVPIDGRVIVSDGYKTTSEIPILFIKHPYNYLAKTDDTLTKSGKAADAKVVGDKFEELARSSKPYFINMDTIDTTNPAVSEAVIDAFFAGRTLIVTDSAQDPGVDQRGYRFVQWVGLPRNGWNMVELRLNDGSSINLAAATRTGDNPYEEYENN